MFPFTPFNEYESDFGIPLIPYGNISVGDTGGNTVSVFGSPKRIGRPVSAVLLLLEVGSLVDSYDLFFDVFIQTRLGNSWFDVALFNRVTAGSTEYQNVAQALKLTASASISTTKSGAGNAGIVNGNTIHILGEEWRARYEAKGTEAVAAGVLGVSIIPIGLN